MSYPSLRPHIWNAVRTLHQRQAPITAPAVRALLTAPPAGCLERIRAYLRALAQTGHLTVESDRQDGHPVAYRLAYDSGSEAPRVRLSGALIPIGSGHERMWHVMRVLRGGFTAIELAVHCSVDDHIVAEGEARDYCQRLARAGYLHVLQRGRWQLVPTRWRGPLPPQVRRDKRLFDPNTGVTYAPTGEVCNDH
jgi:hypothetical protein